MNVDRVQRDILTMPFINTTFDFFCGQIDLYKFLGVPLREILKKLSNFAVCNQGGNMLNIYRYLL